MSYTATEENYIKAIYHLQHRHGKVGTSLLSAEMQTKPASVTDMLKKLELKKILHYKKYRGFVLTEDGIRTAVQVVRKHRLWEFFLVHKLGFSWEDVHSMAEELEHVSSDELIARLDDYLGNPSVDPHGDPIPDVTGRIRTIEQESLLQIPENKWFRVSSVSNQQSEMLELLNHYKIGIGTRLQVLRRFPFDGSVEIQINDSPAVVISQAVAQHVHCTI